MRKLILLAAAMLAFPSRGLASEPLFDSAPLDDEELEAARGGFMLPNGIEIAFGATISTIGNDVSLSTQVVLNDQGGLDWSTQGQVDGQPVDVRVGAGSGNQGGTAVTMGISGTGGSNLLLDLETANIFIRHMVGNGVGVLVANTADNQIINTEVAVDLKLDNVAPLTVGSVGFQIEGMAMDAASFRAP